MNLNSVDYVGDDGLIYCGICREAKQTIYEMMGTQYKHPGDCKCRREEKKDRDAQWRERVHQCRVSELRKKCFRSWPMVRCTFENSTENSDVIAKCKKYPENWEQMRKENVGLLLWGGVGTGKSFMAAAIANALLDQEVSVQMFNMCDFFNCDFAARSKLLAEIAKPELFVLDDLGIERETSFGAEIVYSVIDERYRSSKPIIITTNVPLAEFTNPNAGNSYRRIYDRINEMCVPIGFGSTSLRSRVHQRKMESFRKMLMDSKEGGTD